MKRFILTLAVLLFAASIADAQRTSRLSRPCPGSSTPATVEVERDGDVTITPCVGSAINTAGSGLFRAYDPTYTTPTFSPATSRFTVGSQDYQTIPAANNFIGFDAFSRVTAQNTTFKTFVGSRSELTLSGSPTGQVAPIGHMVSVGSSGTWAPSAMSDVLGTAATVDIGAPNGASSMVAGRFRVNVGSVNVAAVPRLVGVDAYANAGYASTVTDLEVVAANTSSLSGFGGTTTNARLFRATKGTTNTNITNLCGLCIGNYGGGTGTITNNDAIYIDSTVDVGTNRFAIRSESVAPSRFHGKLSFDATYTTAGTTGNRTIDKPAFSVNFAAAASSLTVTNSFVTSSASVLICTVQTNDSTLKSVAAVAGTGSVVLHGNAAATAETKVYCEVKN